MTGALPRGPRDRPRAPRNTYPVDEASYQAQIIDLAHAMGWRTMHVRRMVTGVGPRRKWQTGTSVRGWPDLTLWRGPRLIHVEVKGHRGRLEPDQVIVLGELDQATEAYVTWPWEVQALAAVLARR